MSNEHTPGLMVADVPDRPFANDAYLRINNWGSVARIGLDHSLPHWDVPQRANARRLAACWNAFDGIATADIEGKTAGEVVAAQAYLRSAGPAGGGFEMQLEGDAMQVLAASFANQFQGSGAINFLELRARHPEIGEFVVTMQRQEGKTPGQLLGEVRQQRDDLIETLESVLKHFTRTPSTLADTTVRGDAHAVIKRIREATP